MTEFAICIPGLFVAVLVLPAFRGILHKPFVELRLPSKMSVSFFKMWSFFFEKSAIQSSSHSLPIESGLEVRSLKTWPWVALLESCGVSGMVAYLCDAIISPFAAATVGPESVSCTFLQIFSLISSK